MTRTFALAMLAFGPFAHPASLSVNPVTFTILPAQGSSVLRIDNSDEKAVRVQVTPVAWTLVDGAEHEENSDGLLLNPPIFSTEAQKSQYVRFGLRQRTATDTEQAYRLIIEEVPDPNEPRASGLRTVLRLSVPVFIAPTKPVKHMTWHIEAGAGTTKLVAVNDGNVHQRLIKIAVTDEHGTTTPISSVATYFLAGERREWPIPSGSDASHPLNLAVVNEQGTEDHLVVAAEPPR